jgi:hypothetical protein
MTWQLRPTCAVGACDVILHGKNGGYSFEVKLTRGGAAYTGRAVTHFGPRGTGSSSVPDPVTLKIQIHATRAIGENQEWAATSLAGNIVITFQHVSTAAFYCSGPYH